MARLTESQAGGANVLRFLDLIAFSEGTSTVKGGDDGYSVLYDGGQFQGYADHQHRCRPVPVARELRSRLCDPEPVFAAQVFTTQALKDCSARVSITSKDPTEPVPEASAG